MRSRRSNSRTPSGVAGMKGGLAWARRPALYGLSLVSRPSDLDGEGVEIWERRALAHANGDLGHLVMLEDGHRNSFGDRLQQIGRLAFEDLPGGFLQQRIADGVLNAVGGGRFA